ncbi:MAG: SDR family oxidoreductase [Bacteroidales bacterium]|nr:SDR family oxidoreductase [Bacteroidales bacterium]
MNKVILITGASSGFGKATAEMLAKKGHVVYGTSRKTQRDGTFHFLQMDVKNPESVRIGVEEILRREGRIDVAICNAGIGIGGALELATQEEIQEQMHTNFMGCVNVCQQVLPHMRQQGLGRIVNLSSIGGIMGLPFQGFYSASKFAIEGFTEALAAETRGYGIDVCMVEPGDFATGFTSARKKSTKTAQDAAYGPVFARTLSLVEKEEQSGLKPEKLAKTICHIVECRKPRLRYCVATWEQKLSVLIKRLLPGNWMVGILRTYYKV